jgi:hypothetical protein
MATAETTGATRTGQATSGNSTGAPKSTLDTNAFLKQLSENAPVFVQRPGADAAGRHTGILVGNIRNQMLVIGVYDGVELAPGERIILRMSMGSHLVGFDAQVVKKTDDPPLYFVQFPGKLEAVNLRKAERIQAFFPADVQVSKPGSDQIYLLKTRVLDISAGGCSFRSKTKLPASNVQISFALPGDRHIQSVRGNIIESSQVGMVFHSRIRFIQEPSTMAILQEVAKWVAEGLTFAAD